MYFSCLIYKNKYNYPKSLVSLSLKKQRKISKFVVPFDQSNSTNLSIIISNDI